MAFVSANSGYSSGPIVLTGSPAAGNSLVAFISGDSALTSTALPTGWLKLTPQPLTNSVALCLWVYPSWTGGNVSATITSAPGDPGWSIHQYSGRDVTALAALVDNTDYDTGSSAGATFTTPTITAIAGDDIFVAVAQELAAGTPTFTTSGFTKRTEQTSHVHGTGDDENHPGGSVFCQGSPGANVGHGTAILRLPAATGGAGHPHGARQYARRRSGLLVPHTARRKR